MIPGRHAKSTKTHLRSVAAALEGNLEGNAFDRERFDAYGLVNTFEIYEGTPTSKVADRFQNHVLPFFSRTLCVDRACR